MASEQKDEKSGDEDASSQCVGMEQKKEDLNKKDAGSRISKLPVRWDRFSSWIHCICIVTFDLELGQAIEVIITS